MFKKFGLLMVFVISLFAAESCNSIRCVAKIEKLYVRTSGNISVGTTQDETLANCTPKSGVYFTLDMSVPNAEILYSTLLSAHLSNKVVNIRISENTDGCKIAYVVLDSTLN